jgi:hypothetical protein
MYWGYVISCYPIIMYLSYVMSFRRHNATESVASGNFDDFRLSQMEDGEMLGWREAGLGVRQRDVEQGACRLLPYQPLVRLLQVVDDVLKRMRNALDVGPWGWSWVKLQRKEPPTYSPLVVS